MARTIVASKQLVEEIFDGAALRYDQAGPNLFRQFGERLVEWMNIPSGTRVLDVATGTGAVLIPAARQVGAGGHVIGVDLSNEMLAEADRAASASWLSNFELGRMDAEQLQFADGVFNAVTCGFAIFFFPSMETALRDKRRAIAADEAFRKLTASAPEIRGSRNTSSKVGEAPGTVERRRAKW